MGTVTFESVEMVLKVPKKAWRDAATLMLTAKEAACTHNKFNYKVLMVQRSSKSKFMPNAYVFPGGVISESDFSSDWLSLFNRFGVSKDDLEELILQNVERPFLMKGSTDEFLARDISLRLAAIRETFEECGVLLCRNKDTCSAYTFTSLAEQEVQRKAVHKEPGHLVRLLNDLEVLPDIWGLKEWSCWLTPVMAKWGGGRRFDTIFYIANINKIPPTTLDEKEVSGSVWSSPDELLNKCYKGELWLAPPQVYELSRMVQYQEQHLLDTFSSERHPKGLSTWLPVREECSDGSMSILPGDSRYPSNPDFTGEVEKEIRKFSGSLEESASGSSKLNRIEFLTPNYYKPRVNCEPPNGHINPVSFCLEDQSKG